jgi:serine/threonine protein kinase
MLVIAVILFLGACTKPPRLSMVTEYMEMGSLYYLIHSSGQKKLSWRRRLKMLRDICRYVCHVLIYEILLWTGIFTKFTFLRD